MNRVAAKSIEPRSPGRLAVVRALGGMLVIALALALWAVPVIWVAHGRWGHSGVYSALVAGLVCGCGSWLGILAAAGVLPMHPVNGMLIGTLGRIGVAMLAGLTAMSLGWANGFAECLLANYLFSLIVETFWSVKLAKSQLASSGPEVN